MDAAYSFVGKMYILVISLFIIPSIVLIVATLATLSSPGWNSRIRPRRYFSGGRLSSLITAIVPSPNLLDETDRHLLRYCKTLNAPLNDLESG